MVESSNLVEFLSPTCVNPFSH